MEISYFTICRLQTQHLTNNTMHDSALYGENYCGSCKSNACGNLPGAVAKSAESKLTYWRGMVWHAERKKRYFSLVYQSYKSIFSLGDINGTHKLTVNKQSPRAAAQGQIFCLMLYLNRKRNSMCRGVHVWVWSFYLSKTITPIAFGSIFYVV